MPTEITVQQYRPSEIIAIFNEYLSRQSANQSGRLVYIRGIYLASGSRSYNGWYYDKLRDEERDEEISILVTEQQRHELASGNLVEVGGTLGRNVKKDGTIQLIFNVSRIEVVQNQVVDEAEQKRMELRLKKVEKGFKNVDSILETLIYNDTRPKIALVIATSSIALKDFEDGIRAARVQLDFTEHRVTFTKTSDLCNMLRNLDAQGYHAIAMVRGGGIDAKTDIDKPEVIKTVVDLKTPFIAATGHKDEVIFLRQVADKWTATPQGLGQFFSELVESVSEKKTKSRAALTEQIKKQFKDQLKKLEKQNKETQDKFEKLNKQQEESQKNLKVANAQNKELQEQLKKIQKSHEEQLSKLGETHKTELAKLGENHKSEMSKLNKTLTRQQEEQKKQQEKSNKHQEELNQSIKKMQKTNDELQKSLTKLTAQNTQAAKDLNAAKDKARELERQLEEARRNANKGCLGIAASLAIFIVTVWSTIQFLFL